MNKEMKKERISEEFKLVNIELNIVEILRKCIHITHELRITREIIFHGEEQPMPEAVKAEECKQSFNRYDETKETIILVDEFLEQIKEEIKDLRPFFMFDDKKILSKTDGH